MLPDWLQVEVKSPVEALPTLEGRMQFALKLAQANIDEQTGGPFAAVIVERDSGALISVGVNLVVHSNCSVLHAETVAIMLAQAHYSSYDLAASGIPDLQLVSSAEPCLMCMGAIVWCGIRELVFGASGADVRAIGFDEGPKPAEWISQFRHRNINVIEDVARDDAVTVLQSYKNRGGIIYNSRRSF